MSWRLGNAIVDTNKGHKLILKNSGLLPMYVHKTDYGKVPEYLQRRVKKKGSAEESDGCAKPKEAEPVPDMRLMTAEERQETLKHLRKDWSKHNREYLCLPLVTDTLYRKHRKERLEAKLFMLEKDIYFFERYKNTIPLKEEQVVTG